MRLLHCISNLLSGGAQQQLSYLVSEQERAGLEVHVGYLHPGAKLALFEKTGAVLHRLEASGNHAPGLFSEAYRLIRRVEPDIVQTWLLQMDVVGGLASLGRRHPWVLTERTSGRHYSSGVKPAIRALVGSRADAIVSNSEVGDQYWAHHARAAVLRRVIRNAVPIEDVREAAPRSGESLGLPEGHLMVLYAGRLSPEKNLETLVPALGEVARRLPVTSFLCGDGTHEHEVRSLIESLGLERAVRLVGYVDDVWSWIRRADAFVSVSHFEGNPNAVLEAAAGGCPLVLSDIPGHREMFADSAALFVDRTSNTAIADALERILREPAEAKRRADAARAAVASLSVEAMARKYDEVYREVLDRRGARAAA